MKTRFPKPTIILPSVLIRTSFSVALTLEKYCGLDLSKYGSSISSDSLRKWLANDDFQQDWYSRNVPFSTIYHKTAWRNLPKRQGFQALVYADKPQTLDNLEDNIRLVIADTRPQMLEKVIENWTSRLDYMGASRSSHMPEIIFKM
ncbi:hypothetical protein TNCV_3558411 [Trichonephila clavipes]|uniref:Uncharacterized protein n=1 Tax=Trichonephila clavipes TaxID=2585209 RepID=A0A8X6WC68_TRICX|nr:hypothetical protein TNCV_3558411 [Trichonephila clavipes]